MLSLCLFEAIFNQTNKFIYPQKFTEQRFFCSLNVFKIYATNVIKRLMKIALQCSRKSKFFGIVANFNSI